MRKIIFLLVRVDALPELLALALMQSVGLAVQQFVLGRRVQGHLLLLRRHESLHALLSVVHFYDGLSVRVGRLHKLLRSVEVAHLAVRVALVGVEGRTLSREFAAFVEAHHAC